MNKTELAQRLDKVMGVIDQLGESAEILEVRIGNCRCHLHLSECTFLSNQQVTDGYTSKRINLDTINLSVNFEGVDVVAVQRRRVPEGV